MDIEHILKNYFFLLFFLFWLVISIVISRIGGWAALANMYRFEDSFEGERWRFQSGVMRYAMSYNNCLTIGADRRGVYLSLLFLFRVGHPPLFIPWSDIAVSEKKSFFIKMTEFRFARVPGVYLRISSAIAEKLWAKNAAAGEQRMIPQRGPLQETYNKSQASRGNGPPRPPQEPTDPPSRRKKPFRFWQ